MKKIKLTQNQVAIVDDEDFEWLNQWKWFAQKHRNTFYASRKIWVDKKGTHIRMHNQILGIKGIDHINGKGFDNRRCNLRPATPSQNCMNRRKRENTTSQYKGVSFHKKTNTWVSYISYKYKFLNLGNFKIEIEAALAYNQAALKLFGEFARINNP